MTLDELERSLPNGLHDAELAAIHVNYSRREAILFVNVDVSDPAASDGQPRYRPARVVFSDVQFVVIDAPAGDESYQGLSPIDTGTGQPETASCTLPPIRQDCVLCWVFVANWNSFIRISARVATLEWDDESSDK